MKIELNLEDIGDIIVTLVEGKEKTARELKKLIKLVGEKESGVIKFKEFLKNLKNLEKRFRKYQKIELKISRD